MEEIKEMLLRERDKILNDLEGRSHSVSKEHEGGDVIDNSVDEQGRELMFLLQDRDRVKLEQIQSSLERIQQEEYGDCDECGEPIGKKRLLILPFARLCLNCKKEQERVQGRSLVKFDDDNPRYIDSDE